MTTNGATNGRPNGTTPKIILYTNHGCPYAHRAHIALEELHLPFEEIIIDLKTPRPQWYLDINPRGLVPSIKYTVPGVFDPEILYESVIVAQFFVDSFPSHLLPDTRASPTAPLERARINFFVDTFNTKTGHFLLKTFQVSSAEEKEALCKEWAAAVEKEIEPLLADAAPFFGGSKELTFAEVITAPFVLRWFSCAKDGDLLPGSFLKALKALPNFSRWYDALLTKESVTKIYDEGAIISNTKARIAKMQAAAK